MDGASVVLRVCHIVRTRVVVSMAIVSSGSLHGGERRAEGVQVALGLPMLRCGAEGDALVLDDVTYAEAVGDHRAETEEAQHLSGRVRVRVRVGVGVRVRWGCGLWRMGLTAWVPPTAEAAVRCAHEWGGRTGLPQLEVEMVV